MNDVFSALQATLGGIYINNFNLFGRVWQVNIQGEAADRSDVSSLWQIYIRNKYGSNVPLRSIADARIDRRAAGHHPLQQLPRDPDPGRPVAGHVVRHGARRNGGGLGARHCPPAMATNGPAPPTRRSPPRGRPARSSALAVLFAFLFLVGLYESWMIPVPVLLSVPVAVLGRVCRDSDLAAVARPLRPDRARRADRDGRQERHPDRRIRQGPARAREWTSGRRRCSGRGCGFAR